VSDRAANDSADPGPPPQPHPDQPWYASGVEFECTQCGACCTGPEGYVLYTEQEAERIAAKLSLSVPQFIERYTHDMGVRIAGRRRSLNETITEFGHDCVFLDRTSIPGKTLCSIHDVRPAQCRTFPFWSDVMESPRSWRHASHTCEGIGQGKIVPVEQIVAQLNAYKADRASGRVDPGASAPPGPSA